MFHGACEVKYELPRHMHASRCSCSLAIVQFSPTEVQVEHASCCVGHTLGDVVFHGSTLVPTNILLRLPTVTQQHAADARSHKFVMGCQGIYRGVTLSMLVYTSMWYKVVLGYTVKRNRQFHHAGSSPIFCRCFCVQGTRKRCKLGPDISLVLNYYLTILTVKPFTLSIAQSKKKMSKEKKLQDTLLQTSEPLNTDPCFFYSREWTICTHGIKCTARG